MQIPSQFDTSYSTLRNSIIHSTIEFADYPNIIIILWLIAYMKEKSEELKIKYEKKIQIQKKTEKKIEIKIRNSDNFSNSNPATRNCNNKQPRTL